MIDDVPDGFVLVPLTVGYNGGFGPAYHDATRRRLGFRVAEQHLNPVGLCHGGAIATFADLQIVAAGLYDSHKPTVSLTVDYLAPAGLGDWIEGEVHCLKITRTLIFTQIVMMVADTVVARSSAIYRNSGSTV